MLLPWLAGLPAPAPIVGGEPTDGWPAVVGLYASEAGSLGDLFCSGTLVTPDAVLTCAHCVDRLREYRRGNADVFVVIGTVAPGGIDTFAEVIDEVQHPEWVRGGEVDTDLGSDVALLRLEGPVDGVEPIPWSTEPVDDAWLGLPLDVVGWGATSAAQVDGGTKRHVVIDVTGLEPWWIVHGGSGSGLNTCFGDSGGAVLRTFDDGVTRVVAIPAVIWGGPDICVDGYGWDLRVDLRADFVEDTLAAWAEPVDTGDPPAAVPDPPPTEPPRGCGCDGLAVPGALAAVPALLALRRRQPRRTSIDRRAQS